MQIQIKINKMVLYNTVTEIEVNYLFCNVYELIKYYIKI